MRIIKTGIIAAAVIGPAVITALVFWPIGKTPENITLTGDVQKGAYLARASGCIACHTNFEAGGVPLAGGPALKTDFGTFYPTNLTTDNTHGIGDWSIEDFAKAVRQGVSPEGQPYYPTFTYPFYANFTDQDIVDLWAAFQTVPAVSVPAPEHDAPFPFNQRWGLKLWRAAFLEKPHTDPVPANDDVWNRGRLLVEGASHCAACHTGRNVAGARDNDSQHFQGNDRLPGGGKSPAIDYKTLANRGWDVGNLAYALKTGITPSGDAFGGTMGEVVLQGTKFLSDEDRKAMATYLLDDHQGG